MMYKLLSSILIMALCSMSARCISQDLYRKQPGVKSRMVSFENPSGKPGNGGKENKGGKGHSNDFTKAGESRVLLDYQGSGIISRIWCTIDKRSSGTLRALRLQFFWDGAATPAVDVPFGDFFGVGLGQKVKFESALFSDPEARSFNCFIPMPFRKQAKIVLKNESNEEVNMFYDIDLVEVPKHNDDVLYFHAYWNRKITSELGKDFELLPEVNGNGRFLGVNVGVITDSVYKNTWWGEGEVKMYIDEDKDFPTINGTGTEDYIGSAWGMGVFSHQYQGCLIADDKRGYYTFYRYHIPDPVFFNKKIKVTIQELGGSDLKTARELLNKGVKLKPVAIPVGNKYYKLQEEGVISDINDPFYKGGFVIFYRIDDYSSTSYFYLDKPSNNLPALQEVSVRISRLK